jgi:23S rRNA pseudouridine1911/1915/1917 synthase
LPALCFSVEEDEEGVRLDTFLVSQEDVDQSRSYISTLIRNGHVTVEGEVASKPSARLRRGCVVSLNVPDPEPIELAPENIPLDLVFEDDHLVVVNKQPGLVVHPTAFARSGTLVNGLLYHCRNLSGISGELRPGIVHRLDKDTTGLLVAAKDDVTHRGLSSQLSSRSVRRRYLALCWNHPDTPQGRIDAPIGRHPVNRQKMAVVPGGRRAVTNYRVLKPFRFADLLEFRLETGRTHQIRVHGATCMGCPVIADSKYGGMKPAGHSSVKADRELVADVVRLAGHHMLHAETLGFIHPVTGEEMEFNSAPPMEFRLVQRLLARDSEGRV